ncbi:hypothetical protein Tco_0485028 [Tanacetum coccineum]|uniref:Uncharacterized protein n=1 Tax=Tanacetum coccineum TaxID=301880 RepID=A0ABQ5GAL1_9ASTR
MQLCYSPQLGSVRIHFMLQSAIRVKKVTSAWQSEEAVKAEGKTGTAIALLGKALNNDQISVGWTKSWQKGIEKFETDLKTYSDHRVVKSKLEIAVIQYANDISSEAHIEVCMVPLCND